MPENPVLRPSDWLVRIKPRPQLNSVSQGRTVLTTDLDGWITSKAPEQGLWSYQTRMLSEYRWLIDRKPPTNCSNSNLQQYNWLGYYIAPLPNCKQTETHECNPTQQTLELRIYRTVGDGMHEEVELTNHTQIATEFDLALVVDADFADPKETHSHKRMQRGRKSVKWKSVQTGAELSYRYHARHAYRHQDAHGTSEIDRRITLHLASDSVPRRIGGHIHFRIRLRPHQSWRATLNWSVYIDGHDMPLSFSQMSDSKLTEWDRRREGFTNGSTAFSTGENNDLSNLVLDTLEQAKRDLLALRLFDLDDDDGWTMAAGVPMYIALFGRDTLATSWEALLLGSEMIRGTLPALDRYRGTSICDWRDEQPGKMVHEVHTSPLGALDYTPHGRYYGGVTGSIYYPVVVSGLCHWTGDKQVVAPFLEPALKGLEWADKYGHITDEHFYQYQCLSKQGEKNQGWKDSSDAIVYEDGSQVKDPLGTCEMQSFVYASKLHLSEVLFWLGRREESKALYQQSQELKKRFAEKFWMDDEKYVAMAIDSRNRLSRSIASDPGHCMASGILDADQARHVADRLMSEEMFSGWGVRTLSANHPAFNPFAYHRGTVWPVENAVFAIAFARYGLHDHLHHLAKAQFEAAGLFDYDRLPEVFAGHIRDREHPFPGLYPKANWPQAWSCSAVFTLLQAMLGIVPYAPLNALLLDPHLPEWLPGITLDRLRVGKAVARIRFWRKDDGTSDYRIEDLRGTLHVIRQPSPWSLTADFGERVMDAITSLLPGK